MSDTQGLLTLTHSIPESWTDYNGHMNVAWYVAAFDLATDSLLDEIGIGADYARTRKRSMFALEGHITYDRELLQDDQITVRTFIHDHDQKRIHFFHEMYHATENYLAATHELIGLHMNLEERRSAPFPEEALTRIKTLADRYPVSSDRHGMSRIIGIRR